MRVGHRAAQSCLSTEDRPVPILSLCRSSPQLRVQAPTPPSIPPHSPVFSLTSSSQGKCNNFLLAK